MASVSAVVLFEQMHQDNAGYGLTIAVSNL